MEKLIAILKKVFGPLVDTDNLSTILSGYGRRISENLYTKALDNPFGEKLKSLGVGEKNILEFLMYIASAVGNKKLPENSLTQKTIKGIAMDAASEIAKRIQNHDSALSAAINTPEGKTFLGKLIDLGGDESIIFIRLINSLEEPEKTWILTYLAKLTEEQLKKVSDYTDDQFKDFNILLQSEFFQTKSLSDRINANMNPLRNRLKKYIAEHKPERGN